VQATGTATVSDVITVEVTAGATNQAPVAVDDGGYTVDVGKTLTVAGPGVLGNDSDPDGNPLDAFLMTAPSRGAVSLHLDGSFTYTPSDTTAGTDTFTYRAYDGALYSTAATVSIAVNTVTTADTVTIKSATYTMKKKQLSVSATSTAAPGATLTVVTAGGTWPMKYTARTKLYTLTVGTSPAPTSVTVNSSTGGSATSDVTVK
jgi:hypothetical protein